MKIVIYSGSERSSSESDYNVVPPESLCRMFLDVATGAGYSPIQIIKHMSQFKKLEEKVEVWAEEKGILSKATPIKQAMKTQEEVTELCNAILDGNKEEIMDAIGDILVTIIIQAKMQGVSVEKCLQGAYGVIQNRSGQMINGQFVKDSQ